MPTASIQRTQSIPSTTLTNLSSIHQAGAMATDISSVQALGEDAKIPMSTGSQTPDNPLIMSKNELYGLNKAEQTKRLIKLFQNSNSLDAKEITTSMVESVLNSDGMGSLNQQSCNYRPKTGLVILTLLEKGEMNDELLDSAAKMIKDMQNTPSLADKKIIKGALAEFDKKIQRVMSKIKGDNFSTMVDRFKKEYITPEFKKKNESHLSVNDIKNLVVKDGSLSVEYQNKEDRIAIIKEAYQNTGTNPSVDKSFYLHEAFEALEELLEIPKRLETPVDCKDKLPPVKSESTAGNKINPSDEVDGLSYGSKASSAGNISNSYNTTTINNFYGSSFPESIKQFSQQESTVNQEQEQDSHLSNKTENVKAKPFDNDELSSQIPIKLPRVELKTPLEEPLPDYDSPNHSAQNSQEIDTVESHNLTEPTNVSGPSQLSLTQEKIITDSIRTRFELDVELAQKNSQPMDIKPKMGSHYGSYLIDNKVPNGVRLTNNRELVQDKSTGQTEAESNLAIKNASHYRTSYISRDDKVVLSAEGLMTRNLNEKLAYVNKP